MAFPWELTVPIFLALAAYLSRGLDEISAFTGAVMGYIIIFSQGFDWFLALLVFFLSGSLATRFKYKQKKRIKAEQKRRGIENVLGNALLPLTALLYGNLFAFMGALAAATADTLSSEIGVLSKSQPTDIISGKPVKPGRNGAVSPLGNIAMVVGSLLVASLAIFVFNDYRLFIATTVGGIAGCMADSVLGSTLENRGIIGNSPVNFLATLAGAVAAMAVAGFL